MKNILVLLTSLLLAFPGLALAESIGQIKKLAGDVRIERNGKTETGKLGMPVFEKDIILTGSDGSVGLLFVDDSRMSAGPQSRLMLDEFSFNEKTDEGFFNASFLEGVFSVVAGKLTQKNPDALKVRTPSAVLAVRGTEFSVKVENVAGGAAQ